MRGLTPASSRRASKTSRVRFEQIDGITCETGVTKSRLPGRPLANASL